jgi:hypothetical protein
MVHGSWEFPGDMHPMRWATGNRKLGTESSSEVGEERGWVVSGKISIDVPAVADSNYFKWDSFLGKIGRDSSLKGAPDLPETFVGEGISRMRFKIFLEGKCAIAIPECNICDQFPRFVFLRVLGLAIVMGSETGFQIFSETDVGLIREFQASQEIHIIHFRGSRFVLQLRKTGCHA